MIRLVLAALCSFATPALAQLVVDFSDSVLSAPQGQYPIYTGSGTNVIRGQTLCAGTFAGLPTSQMVCTHFGVQLAEVNGTGPVQYSQFVVRFGSTPVATLTGSWATNLPDQRVQLDLSGQFISGGVGANQWFEWPLLHPFVYNPGDGMVIDITSQAAVAGTYLRTAIASSAPRCVSTNYTGGNGSATTSGGIKFRMVFETSGFVVNRPGCDGSGAITPEIAATGAPTLGNASFTIDLQNALGGALCGLVLGFPTDLDIGGGCHVWTNSFGFVLLGTSGSGAGNGTASFPFPIPNNPSLVNAEFAAQWGVSDPGSASPFGLAMSSAATLLIF
ncbi:MAG: hypothetical protein KDE27_23120 [Planctomycetes bacterium]|nr:hypothetical protein [Planctomycetota bacterium]